MNGPKRHTFVPSMRQQTVAAASVTIAFVSIAFYVGSGLIWVDDVWARKRYGDVLTCVTGGYYVACLLLALLLFVAGLAHWDNEWWARWLYYAYCIGTFASLSILWFAGKLLAPDDPDWGDVFLFQALLLGSYAVVIRVFLLLKKS